MAHIPQIGTWKVLPQVRVQEGAEDTAFEGQESAALKTMAMLSIAIGYGRRDIDWDNISLASHRKPGVSSGQGSEVVMKRELPLSSL